MERAVHGDEKREWDDAFYAADAKGGDGAFGANFKTHLCELLANVVGVIIEIEFYKFVGVK